MQRLIEDFLKEQFSYAYPSIAVSLGDDNETYVATVVTNTTFLYLFHKFYVEIASAPMFSNMESDAMFSELSQSYRRFIYTELLHTNPIYAKNYKEEWNKLAENTKQKMIEEVEQSKL